MIFFSWKGTGTYSSGSAVGESPSPSDSEDVGGAAGAAEEAPVVVAVRVDATAETFRGP